MSTLPRQIGPFRVLRRLGVGGVGEVLLAVAHGAGGFEKRVALKVLREELRGDADFERVLLEEARMAARFDHPNLVGVHDVGVSNGVYWVRMDRVDGGDLGTLLGSAGGAGGIVGNAAVDHRAALQRPVGTVNVVAQQPEVDVVERERQRHAQPAHAGRHAHGVSQGG